MSLCACGCGGATASGKWVRGHHLRRPQYRVEERGYRTPCWTWLQSKTDDGYGVMRERGNGRTRLAHRCFYETLKGTLAAGSEIDHLCRNRDCVNPDHLELVTHAENVRRSSPAVKTTCVNGHVLDTANTYVRPNGHRDCRKCGVERQRRYQARRAAA